MFTLNADVLRWHGEAVATVLDLDGFPVLLTAAPDRVGIYRAPGSRTRRRLTPFDAAVLREQRIQNMREEALDRRRRGAPIEPGDPLAMLAPRARETVKLAALGTGYGYGSLDRVDAVRRAAADPEAPAHILDALASLKQPGASINAAYQKVVSS